MDCAIVLTTLPADADGRALADTLIGERLAACVNIMAPMESVYRWKSEIIRDNERQLIIKTTPGRLRELQARLAQLHPYEIPEFVVLQASTSDSYGRWLADETIVQ